MVGKVERDVIFSRRAQPSCTALKQAVVRGYLSPPCLGRSSVGGVCAVKNTHPKRWSSDCFGYQSKQVTLEESLAKRLLKL